MLLYKEISVVFYQFTVSCGLSFVLRNFSKT